MLKKEVISDQSTYYHFSLNIIGEDDHDWIKKKVVIKHAKFLNLKFIFEAFILMMFPLPGKDKLILIEQTGGHNTKLGIL